jgi:hypothetical protein
VCISSVDSNCRIALPNFHSPFKEL